MRCWVISSRTLLAAAAVWMGAAAETVERRLGVMGTSLHLEIWAGTRPGALAASEAAVRAIEAAERRLSTWRDGSELSRLSQTPVGDFMELAPETAEDLRGALACAEATGGAFDPAMGSLVRAWDLRGRGRIPPPAELAEARARSGHDGLAMKGGRALRRRDVLVEEGAFGKGAALDWAARALEGEQVEKAMVDLGGQVLVLGGERRVPLAHPEHRDRAVLHLTLSSGSAATTGNSERRKQVEGIALGHVLDPRTGRPARDWGAVTVVAENAAWADCLSTALFVLGPDSALAFAAARPGTEAVVVETGETVLRARATAGLKGRLAPVTGARIILQFVSGESE